MGDMREELLAEGARLMRNRRKSRPWDDFSWDAQLVIDSIPPGSFKREDGTWGRLERIGRGHFRRGRFELHTEDIELTCDPSPSVYTETTDA